MKTIYFCFALFCSSAIFGNLAAGYVNELDQTNVLANLKNHFGDTSRMNIVEIGGEQGALCKIIAEQSGFASYTIINSFAENELAKENLSQSNISNVHFIDKNTLSNLGSYDLVISNYTFSQCDISEQYRYINALFPQTPNGYMHLNFKDVNESPSLALEDMIALLIQNQKVGKVENESPATDSNHYIITWRSTVEPHITLPKVERPEMLPSSNPQLGNAVTYSFSQGRLGDNLISYFHAKWIALKYGLPFIYKPFDYSNELCMDNIDPQQNESYKFTHSQLVHHEYNCLEYQDIPQSTLLTIAYFPELKHECEMRWYGETQYFETKWDDPLFRMEVKKALTPKHEIATVELPKDKITIGVHVRRGGSYESFDVGQQAYPLKFPPLSYYISQLKRMVEILKDKQIYIYILTDDRDPGNLADIFQSGIGFPSNVEFGFRTTGNDYNVNVLNDFFSIGKFDCFVGSGSNFSIVGTKLGDYTILITPTHSIKIDNIYNIDQVEINFNGLSHP